jgi:hypothetical protein
MICVTIESLSLDIWSEIFQYLKIKELFTLTNVSKNICAIVEKYTIVKRNSNFINEWVHHPFSEDQIIPDQRFVESNKKIRNKEGIDVLFLRNPQISSLASLIYKLENPIFKYVTKLILVNLIITKSIAERFHQYLPNLLELSIMNSLPEEHIINQNTFRHICLLIRLESLKLSKISFDSGKSLNYLSSLTNLKHLTFFGCYSKLETLDEILERYLVPIMNKLQKFYSIEYGNADNNDQSKIGDKFISSLSKINNLKKISIFNGIYITDEGLKLLQNIQKLKVVYLQNVSINGTGLCFLSQIVILNINRITFTQEGFVTLLRLQNIHQLSICESNITDKGILNLLNNLKKLNCLYIRNYYIMIGININDLEKKFTKCKITIINR